MRNVRQAYIDTNCQAARAVRPELGIRSRRGSVGHLRFRESRWRRPPSPAREEQDPELLYNPASVEEIEQRYPQMNWRSYLYELGIAGTERVIYRYPDRLSGSARRDSRGDAH